MPATSGSFVCLVWFPDGQASRFDAARETVKDAVARRRQGQYSSGVTLAEQVQRYLGPRPRTIRLSTPFGPVLALHSRWSPDGHGQLASPSSPQRPAGEAGKVNLCVRDLVAVYGGGDREHYGVYVFTGADSAGNPRSLSTEQEEHIVATQYLFARPAVPNDGDSLLVCDAVADVIEEGWQRVSPPRAYPVYLRRRRWGWCGRWRYVRVRRVLPVDGGGVQVLVEPVESVWLPRIELPARVPASASLAP